jgi:hypothetical protein
MAYVYGNPKTKKALKEMFAAGDCELFEPVPWAGKIPFDGTVYLEGPHYPEPHRWYAQAKIVGGKVVKIT